MALWPGFPPHAAKAVGTAAARAAGAVTLAAVGQEASTGGARRPPLPARRRGRASVPSAPAEPRAVAPSRVRARNDRSLVNSSSRLSGCVMVTYLPIQIS